MTSANLSTNPTLEVSQELAQAYALFNERLFNGELPGALITLQRHGRTLGFYSPEQFGRVGGGRADEIALNPIYFATRPIEDALSTLAHEMAHQWRYRSQDPGRRCYHDKIWAEKMIEIGLHPSHTGMPGGKIVGEKMSHYVLSDGLFIKVAKELLMTGFTISWFDRFPRESGKDYAYGLDATVTVAPATKAAAASGQATPTEQDEGLQSSEEQAGTSEVPMFTPPLVEAGVDVASVEQVQPRASAKAAVNSSNRVKFTCTGCRANAWGKPTLKLICGACSKAFQPTQ